MSEAPNELVSIDSILNDLGTLLIEIRAGVEEILLSNEQPASHETVARAAKCSQSSFQNHLASVPQAAADLQHA